MITKNFLTRIRVTKYTYVIILLSFLCGMINEISAVSILILFHEFGHFLASTHYKWNIKEITLYPFGGIIKYEEVIDKPLFEEFVISVSGIIGQSIIFFIFYILNKNYLVDDSYYHIIKNYHISMIIFNLLPIIPLDGSKIFNCILNKIFSFRLSYNLLSIVSLIFLIFFVYEFKNNYSYYVIITFLIYEFCNYIMNKKYIFNRFIFEKYLFKNKYKKIYKVNSIKKMKKNKKHVIKVNNNYLTEKDAIKKIKGV